MREFTAHQLSRHEPTEVIVCGVVCRNEIEYTGPQTFQNSLSQGATIDNTWHLLGTKKIWCDFDRASSL